MVLSPISRLEVRIIARLILTERIDLLNDRIAEGLNIRSVLQSILAEM